MILKNFLTSVITFSVLFFSACSPGTKSQSAIKNSPNIIFIYLDDLGYGDVGAYGATEIKTPNMDKLVNGGLKFTNGYATSSTCTPSRYALLTGTYPWRNKDAKILPGTAPLLIDTNQLTLPAMLSTLKLKLPHYLSKYYAALDS